MHPVCTRTLFAHARVEDASGVAVGQVGQRGAEADVVRVGGHVAERAGRHDVAQQADVLQRVLVLVHDLQRSAS